MTGCTIVWGICMLLRKRTEVCVLSLKFRTTQAIEAVMIIVAGRWGQRASSWHRLIPQRADELRLMADDALDSGQFGHLEGPCFKKTCADNGIGFTQWFEHGGSPTCGVILASQKHSLDAQPLACLDGTDD